MDDDNDLNYLRDDKFIDKQMILSKIASVRQCLQRIKDVTNLDPKSLANIDKQDLFVLQVLRITELLISMASHIVSIKNYGLASFYKDNFIILRERAGLNSELCQQMCNMVGFRNIAIHEYKKLDLKVMQLILSKNLIDVEDFIEYMTDKFRI